MCRLSWAALKVVLVGVMVGCCDKGTTPVPPKEYAILFVAEDFGDGSNELFYSYLPGSDILDSFSLSAWPSYGMSISADGRQLWFATGDSFYVVDMESKTLAARMANTVGGHPVAFSPDNRLAALLAKRLHIVSTADYSVVFEDSSLSPEGYFGRGAFSLDSRRFYCAEYPDCSYMVDLNSGGVGSRIHFDSLGYIYQVLPSIDETKLFIAGRIAGTDYCLFSVYDLIADSVVFISTIGPYPVRPHVSPDGCHVFITAEGNIFTGPVPPYSFARFDIQKNFIEEEVKIRVPGVELYYYPLGRLAITPDGHYLAGTWYGWPDHLIVYDLIKNDTAHVVFLSGKAIANVVSQVSP
jgi:hypothetical protein